MNNIKNDLPIENVEEDLFNRVSFAENIADIIYNIDKSKIKEQGIVFGLNGTWGSGKSSLINLIKDNLIQKGYQILSNKKFPNFYSSLWKAILVYIILNFHFLQFFLEFDVVKHFFEALPFQYYTFTFLVWLLRIFLIILVIFLKPFEFVLIRKAFNQIKNCCLERFQNIFNKKALEIPIILDFNPWNCCSEENILKDFFNLISNQLVTLGEYEIRHDIEEYASKVLYQCSKGLLNFQNTENISKSKEKINNCLKESNKRFIIFIDDLDRLSSAEIVLVFKIIKSIANLPNIIYFLSYDESIVSQALNDYHKEQGHDFLDKIIQVPFEMPIIDQDSLDKNLKKELVNILKSTQIFGDMWEQQYKKYWSYVFEKDFVLFFSTMRDVKRFINSFYVTYTKEIKDEVNIVDFWFITAIKLFIPELNNFIKANKDFLIQKLEYNSARLNSEEKINYLKENLDKILSKPSLNYSLRQFLNKALLGVFPSLELLEKKRFYTDYYDDKSRIISGRICCAEHFDKYFMYDVSETKFTNVYMQKEIQKAKNKRAFVADLLKLNKSLELKTFFNKLENFINSSIEIEIRENIINTLFLYGDYFNLYDEGFLESNIYVSINRIIFQILNLEDTNSNILRKSFSVEKSIVPAISFVNSLNNMIIKNDNYEYANKTEYNYYSKLILDSIQEWADNDLNNQDDSEKPYRGRLIEHRDACYLLYFWQQNGKGVALTNYISTMTRTDNGLLKFINKLKSETKSATSTGYQIKNVIHGYNLKPFFEDLDSLKDRLLNIDKTSLSKIEVEILEEALKGIDERQQPNYET